MAEIFPPRAASRIVPLPVQNADDVVRLRNRASDLENEVRKLRREMEEMREYMLKNAGL